MKKARPEKLSTLKIFCFKAERIQQLIHSAKNFSTVITVNHLQQLWYSNLFCEKLFLRLPDILLNYLELKNFETPNYLCEYIAYVSVMELTHQSASRAPT